MRFMEVNQRLRLGRSGGIDDKLCTLLAIIIIVCNIAYAILLLFFGDRLLFLPLKMDNIFCNIIQNNLKMYKIVNPTCYATI